MDKRLAIALMIITVAAAASLAGSAQQTCQAGTYTLSGNLKVNGNIESTGTIQGTNVKATSAQQTGNCEKLASLSVPSSGNMCWGMVSDTRTIPVPACMKSGHCYFLLKNPSSTVQTVGSSNTVMAEFLTFPGASDAWTSVELSPGAKPIYSPLLAQFAGAGAATGPVPQIRKGAFGGTSEMIMNGAGTIGYCAVTDDPGGNRDNLQIQLQSCILPSACEFWACS